MVEEEKKVKNEKSYFYYENQRWYLGLGFIPTHIERPKYSDESGDFSIEPKMIKLKKGF